MGTFELLSQAPSHKLGNQHRLADHGHMIQSGGQLKIATDELLPVH